MVRRATLLICSYPCDCKDVPFIQSEVPAEAHTFSVSMPEDKCETDTCDAARAKFDPAPLLAESSQKDTVPEEDEFFGCRAGDHDYELLVLQWPASWRHVPKTIAPDDFTLHGLWPTRSDSCSFPCACDSRSFDPKKIPALQEMKSYWGSFQGDSEKILERFWKHEWVQHGTCVEPRMEQEDFLARALQLRGALGLRDKLAELGAPISTSGAAGARSYDEWHSILERAVGVEGSARWSCNSESDEISGAYVCVTPDGHTGARKVVACPDNLGSCDSSLLCTPSSNLFLRAWSGPSEDGVKTEEALS